MEPIIFDHAFGKEELVNGREHQKYRLKSDVLVPGVTTVLGILNKPQLIHWAADIERKGVINCYNKNESIPEKLFYLTTRDEAGSIGTITHFFCQCYVTQKNPVFNGFEEENIVKAFESFKRFKEYWDAEGYKLVASEIQLVSESLAYGGTIDIVAKDKQDNLVILDIKTGKAVYSDYITQLAAYEGLWNENNDGNKIKLRKIIRIGKEDPVEFEVKDVSDHLRSIHFMRFLSALHIYKINKEIEEIDPRQRKKAFLAKKVKDIEDQARTGIHN